MTLPIELSSVDVVGVHSQLVGHPDQVAGTRLSRVVGGPGDCALILAVWTPCGTEIDLQVDRALDILAVRHGGVRFGWAGPSGLSSRTAYEAEGYGWQRTFYGGLLTTCGLEHVGDPTGPVENDQGPPNRRTVSYGEHGRISHSVAEIVERTIDERAGIVRVRGVISQGAIYDERFELDRTIEVRLDRPELRVRDTVRNTGSMTSRHAILYHVNFGHPIAAPGATVTAGPNSYRVPALTPTAREVVQKWDIEIEHDGSRIAEISTARGDRVVRCTQSATLPHFFLWNVPRSHTNALGLAPSSTPLSGEIMKLDPDETRSYELRLELGELSRKNASERATNGSASG